MPLGYDVKDRKLIVNEPEAATARLIFRRYAELGSVSLLRAELDRLESRVFRTAIRPLHEDSVSRCRRSDAAHLFLERGQLGFVLRCRAEVLVEPPVGGAPGLGTLLTKPPHAKYSRSSG